MGFACMLHYAHMSFYHEKLGRTLVPLFFSGLFMGLGIASKWIGIYAGAGLAVFFFAILYSRFAQYRQAKRLLRSQNVNVSEVAYRTGYQDYRSFSRAFKHETGLTPSEYQNRQKGEK